MIDRAALRVPLNGYAMQLSPAELESVAAGLSQFEASLRGGPNTLAEALRQLPVNDRAPAWELSVRRFGRRRELARAAGEIGMDVIHAQDLLDAYFGCLAAGQPREQDPAQTL
jgi:hypothetical protein